MLLPQLFIFCFIWLIFWCISAVNVKTYRINLLVSFLKGFYVKLKVLELYAIDGCRFAHLIVSIEAWILGKISESVTFQVNGHRNLSDSYIEHDQFL